MTAGPMAPVSALPAPPDAEAVVELPGTIELGATLWPLAHGTGDPTIRFAADGVWRATRMPAGPVTLHLRPLGPSTLGVRAWGPASEPALGSVDELVGGHDDPAAFVPVHPILAQTVRRHPGLRLPRTRRVLEALVPAILEQKITGVEARRVYRSLVRRHGEPAPGPARLWLQPAPSVLAGLPYYAFHRVGLERRRAELIREVARQAARLEAAPSPAHLERLLRAIPGIGPWTAAEVLRVAWGAPDAISLGDYHIPHLVAWALAGEARANETRMLELLEPYRGQRGRVQRLLEASGVRIPRFGPRTAARSIESL
ncbi:MAG TPA: DNA-3-methyladenine glycosylase 2 family protein [Candidatus Limnocylindria bacterium]|nr:DNA-3-methyladenine glycosylase 2 family protein [Candidatus Limnocylindria bacterium]